MAISKLPSMAKHDIHSALSCKLWNVGKADEAKQRQSTEGQLLGTKGVLLNCSSEV